MYRRRQERLTSPKTVAFAQNSKGYVGTDLARGWNSVFNGDRQHGKEREPKEGKYGWGGEPREHWRQTGRVALQGTERSVRGQDLKGSHQISAT